VRGERNANRILVVKYEGRRTLGRYRRIWADNIKFNVTKMDLAYANWIYERQDRTLDGLL
jgi:hypothetical protein